MPQAPLTLTAAARHAMDRLAADLARVFESRLIAVVAYSPTRAAGFVQRIASEDLQALAPLVERWHREALETPLLLTPDEFQRSLDVFPLEYEAMLDRHVVIAGTPPFADVHPTDADLRRACEVQAQSFLIHLRQGWLHAADHHDDQKILLTESAGPLRLLLLNIARLDGVHPATDDALAAFAASRVGLAGATVGQILALEQHPDQADVLLRSPAFMNEYLGAAETLWAFVDRWRA